MTTLLATMPALIAASLATSVTMVIGLPAAAQAPIGAVDDIGLEAGREMPDEPGLVMVPGKMVVEFADESQEDGTAHTPGDLPGGGPELARRLRVAQARADELAREIRNNRGVGQPDQPDSPASGVGGLELDIAAGGAVLVGGLNIVYNPSEPTPSYARPAIEAGLGAWGSRLSTNGAPVTVEVSWVSFGDPGVLGFSGPTDFFRGPEFPTGNLYPAALANVLTGVDHNGAAVPEIVVALNADLHASGTWYYGSGSPASHQIDLTTAVTHEMGHGVGFVSSAVDNFGSIQLASPPFIYDNLIQQRGVPIRNRADVGAVLTSGDADIKISTQQIAPLFVPTTWYPGTSASHFLNTGPTANSLMAPTLVSGMTSRRVDGYTLGVLRLMGWPIIPGPITPSITSTLVDGTAVTVLWQPRNVVSGIPADRYLLEAYVGSTRVSSEAVSGSARSGIVSGLAAQTTHEIRVVPVAAGRRGTAAVARVTTGNRPVYGTPDPIPSFVRDRWLDHQIFRAYQAHFLRAPDRAGFNHWLDRRARGLSLVDMIVEFQSGAEFVNRYGSLTNTQFVQLVYRNVLGREADSNGLNHWVGQLAAGRSRAEVMLGFVESTEYARRTSTRAAHSPTEGSIRRLFPAYFQREPSAGDLSYWVGVADSGTS
ncbi:MAG: DUF4214 domain-containing protein, partial [Acidimicrobiia bacterium]|nr:DUF4214 domain-containing protein [Acidimicrobiia bacterium]